MLSRDLEKNRLRDMVLKLYELVDKLLDMVAEGKKSSFSRIEELTSSVEEYKNIISSQAILFIARYQPLADDLMVAEGIISVSYDLYRVARYAREIAILSEHIGGLRGNVNDDVLDAFNTARSMLRKSIEAFIKGKSEYISEVDRDDSLVDEVYHRYLAMLSKGESLSYRDAASLLLARHVERIADHATYIARMAERIWRVS